MPHPANGDSASSSLQNLLGQLRHSPRSSLSALLRADQGKRWRRGERVLAEAYLAHLPGQPDEALDIIFSEIALREELGEKPTQAEYLQRFPQYQAQVQRQFLLNQALDDCDLFAEQGNWTLPGASSAANTSPEVTVDLPCKSPSPDDPQQTLPVEQTLDEAPAKPRKGGPRPDTVPGYEIISELGRGGMGVVYKARHIQLKRLVALKMILAGSHASPQDLARLRGEAEAVARLRHPNIVQIHEVGELNGLPYLSLEYVSGGSLADKLDGTPLPPLAAAMLVERLARAMHHAHEENIIHRDLKPGNVLLEPPKSSDATINLDSSGFGSDTSFGVPKITDFGLAKNLGGESNVTGSGAIVGTPSYMAPEQAAGKAELISPRTDVYALGALLYECLTGRPPFRAATAMDTILQVMSEDPVPPTQLQPNAPRDLETIAMKCLQKEPERRYASALALAEDLCAYRDGRPIAARPVSFGERAVKWARRRPAIAALLALVVLVSVVGFSLVTWQWQIATTALDDTEKALRSEEEQRIAKGHALEAREEALRDAKVSLYFNRIALAERDWAANDVVGVLKLLEAAPRALRHWEWHYLSCLCRSGRFTLPGKDAVAVSPDGKLIASPTDRDVTVWQLGDKSQRWVLESAASRVNQLAFSPDSQRLAGVSDDGAARVWDMASGKVLHTLKKAAKENESAALPVRAVAFSPDHKLLATAGDDDAITLWDARTGKEGRTLTGHTSTVTGLAFSPDSRTLASSSKDQTVRLWDLAASQDPRTLHGHQALVSGVAFRPDGKQLASSSEDTTVRLWDVATAQEVRTLRGHPGAVNCVTYSNQNQLASASGDYLKPGDVRLWDANTGEQKATFRWPTQEITGLAFTGDGKQLASADQKSVIVWDATNDLESRSLRGHKEVVMACAFSPTAPLVASGGEDWVVKVWDLATEQLLHECAGHTATVNAIAWTPDGQRIVTASDDRTIKVFENGTGKTLFTLRGHTVGVLSIAVSPDGKTLASAASTPEAAGEVKLWDLRDGKELKTLDTGWVRTLAFSPDGRQLAGGVERPFRVAVWDVADGKELRSLTGFYQPISAVAYSADGRWLAASGGSKKEGIIKLWDAVSGEEHDPIRTRTGRIGSIAFSSDGQRLAAASWDHTPKIFDPKSGQDVLTLRGHTDGVTGVAFSPDNGRIASASRDKTVRLWNATTMPPPAPTAQKKRD